ncbi:MAG TPA: hypothetical protein VFL29_14200 [Candidatus Dormibacteraeota bacterium]|nr:hypothetical protein [Candidatus Dormibacteraeota bacterium]
MPESEPKPRPLESVPAGSAQGWKAVLKSGRPVVVHEIPVPPAAAAAAVPRIQRLSEHPHPSLSPVLAWGTDANGVWIAVEPNEGTPLSTVLARGRFTPHAAAALGTSILSGVAALHEAGVAMGGFDATAVRLTANGEVRLAGHPVAAVRGAPSQGDLRADVRSCGMAICAAFGVDPAGAPAPPELPPGLVVTMRSMASGAMGPAVDRALGALREMAGALMAPDRQIAAQSELALRAGGREMPSVTPFVPEAPRPAPAPAPVVEDTPAPRPASYEPPPRSVDTYSSLPRPQETYPAPAAYRSAPPQQAEPVEPVAPPAPAPEPPPIVPAPAMFEPAASTPAPDFAPEHPDTPADAGLPTSPATVPEPAPLFPPEPAPVQEPAAAAMSWEPAEPAAAPQGGFAEPAASAPSPAATNPPPESEWPEPGKPESPAPAAPAAPVAPSSGGGASTWSPVQTGSWNPGSGHISSSEWTGEATPIPAPVPQELREAVTSPSYTPPSYTAPATYAPPAAPVTTPPIPRAPAPAPAKKPAAKKRPDDGGVPGGGRPRWVVPAAIIIVLLLVLGGGGAFALSKLGSSSNPVAHTSPSPSPTHKASPTPTNVLKDVPVYAPAAAAPVTSVTIDPANSSCTQVSGSCKLEVDIKFSSVQRSNVSFIVKFFDRCSGTTTDLPGASFTPPGFNLVILDKTVQLPQGAKSAAVVAVTQTPAVAASAPILLGADSC